MIRAAHARSWHPSSWPLLQGQSDKFALPAGATADAFTLFERLEMQLEQHSGESGSSAMHCPAVPHVC